ncbi:oxidoreductase [Breznakia pachnodae]|uniref:2,4-dienoyl-CoA reductase-like NADH-dependent reductase (Old Yellow Enzyme family)/thioredoxin reductase n=1 Tax=Breznakia pachnodae TaxID=265178 RepID=A0ABU0E8H4_9FIRM|nr:FAD-dependent oxidoreductase [Breznakia pachnodae]MDQ0363021.1 2,4-dienoyl-CoA reductase-like NADH-dependent reductase (Old Yellow Enzyme family)/thioredoxin reductase [Breznakia pachnodae]
MKSKYKKIFEPLMINQMILKNRIFGASGVSADTVNELGGIVAPEAISLGGASMIFTCMCDLNDKKSRFEPTKEYALNKLNRDLIRSYVKRIHQGGAKYILEIDHVGEYHRSGKSDFSWGTIDKINEKGINVKGLDTKEMNKIADSFAQTALDAISLGFDGILFDCSSGWLMSQFLSTHYNKREDEYGGTVSNRCRFPLMVLQRIRDAVGKNYPILCQICANEYFDDGTPFDDILEMTKILESYIDCVIVVCGNDQTRLQMTKLVSTNLESFMMTASYTKKLKEVLQIPVASIGGIMTPEEAEYMLENNMADMIGLCRPLIADHEWVNKAMNNHSADIRPCIRCNNCFHVSSECKHVGCSVNPYYTQVGNPFLKEKYDAEVKKNIVILGGGPAGINAALAADSCGHNVTLIEKNTEVGGWLNYIAKEHFKSEVKRYLNYLKRQLNNSDVRVLLNTEAKKEKIVSLNPDKLIIAIGGKENTLKIEGITSINSYSIKEAICKQDTLKGTTAIIGGGVVGVELALGLAQESNRNIIIVESSDQLAKSANLIYRPSLLNKIEEAPNITTYLNSQCSKVDNRELLIEYKNKTEKIKVDNIIVSIGVSSQSERALQYYGIIEDTVMVGDINAQGNIIDAVYGGYSSGINVTP